METTANHTGEGLYAVDPGTGQIKMAVPDISGPKPLPHPCGSMSVPSVISYAGKKPKFGTQAMADAFLHPDKVVFAYKRHLGSDKKLAEDYEGKPVTARRVALDMIRYSKACYEKVCGLMPRLVVICIPANFTEQQRKDMIEAGEANNLVVVLLVHEPTAAGLGNRLHKRSPGKTAVVDIGHGTTDVSLIEVAGNDVTALAANGVARLGGIDFDQCLQALYLDRFEQEHGQRPNPDDDPVFKQELSERIEQAKKTLSANDSATIVATHQGRMCAMEISREQFEASTKGLLDQAMDCLAQTLKEKDVLAKDLEGILAVGGASSMPMVARAIEERFGVAPLKQCEQHHAAANGGVIAGQIELERQGKATVVNGMRLPPINIYTHERTTHACGVGVLDPQSNEMVHSVLLEKGVPMPSTQTARFALSDPGQTSALVEIRQGPDSVPIAETELLGKFEMHDMQPVWDGEHGIEIRFKIDRHGMLNAHAVDLISNVTVEMDVPTNTQASPESPGV